MSSPKCFTPSLALLSKLGSIIIHFAEMVSSDGHDFDKIALNHLLVDPDVREWLAEMDRQGLLPKKRNP